MLAIEDLGYRRNNAARMLVTSRSRRIGMVSAHLSLYGPSMIAVSLQEQAHVAGYDASVVGLSEFSIDALRRAVDRLLDEAVEALVIAVAHETTLELALSLELSVPVVIVQGVHTGQAMAVGIDQVAGAELATGHLLDLGHRQVAHVTGPLDWIEAGQRRAGWRAAHECRGLDPGPEIAGDWSTRSRYEAGLRISDARDVSAVFAANDAIALGVLTALHERGRQVPEKISVVGFDDVPDAGYYWPPLTTVRQDFAALGHHAVDLAVRGLEGEEQPIADLIAPELVIRRTTQPRTAP